MRFALLFLALAVLVTLPFVIWGADFESVFTPAGAVQWIEARGAWGAAALVALLAADVVLPVPATPLISAAGYVYGPVTGAALGALGSTASGLIAYCLCRKLGRRAAQRIVGEAELERARARFERSGPWIVALSRWMPIVPEVTSCLAGLTRMDARTFTLALVCGTLPMACVYAWIGASGHDAPLVALALSALVPGVLLLAVGRLRRRE